MALVCFLHFNLHLVGLRRMRLCLILRSGLCPKNPQGTLSLDPASPLTPGLSLRFISRYARCRGHNFGQLCSLLTPHSSLLTKRGLTKGRKCAIVISIGLNAMTEISSLLRNFRELSVGARKHFYKV